MLSSPEFFFVFFFFVRLAVSKVAARKKNKVRKGKVIKQRRIMSDTLYNLYLQFEARPVQNIMGALHPSGVTSADGLCRLRAGTGILASAKIFSMWQMKPIDWELCKQLEKMFFYNKV